MLEAFSKLRFGGEPIPDDIKRLLEHRDEFFQLTGIYFALDADQALWNDTSYLSAAELERPDIANNIRAMTETNSLIAFFAVSEDDEYFGFWRGPERRAIADSPLVWLDNEGQYQTVNASSFGGALLEVLTWNDDLRPFLERIGVELSDEPSGATWPDGLVTPEDVHRALYEQYSSSND